MLRSSRQLAAAALSIVAAAAPLRSQATAVRRPAGPGVVRGRLADSASGRLIATASITIRRGTDAATMPARSREDGSFRIEGLAAGSYALTVRALGFAPLRRAGIVISTAAPDVDLGEMKLAGVVTTLEGEHVVAERAETVVSPDRTSYSTKNMTAAAGGTAVDVLRNIPLRRGGCVEQGEPARQRERHHSDQRAGDATQGRPARRVSRAAPGKHREERGGRAQSVGEG